MKCIRIVFTISLPFPHIEMKFDFSLCLVKFCGAHFHPAHFRRLEANILFTLGFILALTDFDQIKMLAKHKICQVLRMWIYNKGRLCMHLTKRHYTWYKRNKYDWKCNKPFVAYERRVRKTYDRWSRFQQNVAVVDAGCYYCC